MSKKEGKVTHSGTVELRYDELGRAHAQIPMPPGMKLVSKSGAPELEGGWVYEKRWIGDKLILSFSKNLVLVRTAN